MADVRVEEKSAGRYTWVWMALALVLTAGLLVWLGVASEPTDLQVVEAGGEQGPAAGVPAVPVAEFAANPDQFVGQEVRLVGLSITDVMGPQTFWTRPAGGSPYLIRLEPSLVEQGSGLQVGDTVTVAGTVHTLTDSVVAAWEQAGVIEGAGERAEVQFASSFLEAAALQGGAAGGAGAGTAADTAAAGGAS